MKSHDVVLPQISEERNGEQWCKHWNCCGWQNGMFWDEATLNSEEIKPVTLAISEICLSEGISQSVR